jgi:DNA (cytosine-5)-methyltransferase 1
VKRPRALDLFCGAGGVTKGLQRAGFYVVGVDVEPQPRYCGDEFVCADALTFPLEGFDFVWASPPCQFASEQTPPECRDRHENLIPPMRERLIETGKPYIIENVEGARFHLRRPVMLCGSMFGMRIWRHRYFELSPHPFFLLPRCDHSFTPVVVSGQPRRVVAGRRAKQFNADEKRAAMGTEWMSKIECSQAIPPAYSEFLGRQILAVINQPVAGRSAASRP